MLQRSFDSLPPQLGTNNAVRILSTNLKKTSRKTMIIRMVRKDDSKVRFDAAVYA